MLVSLLYQQPYQPDVTRLACHSGYMEPQRRPTRLLTTQQEGYGDETLDRGFDEFPDSKPGLRDQLNREFDEKGISYLQEKLKIADPEYYKRVDLNNPQRVIRALEVFESTGQPYSSYRKSMGNKRPFRVIKFGLNLAREALYQRISRRVDDMVKQGLVEEVRSLLPYRHLNALNTVGYSELFDYFDGKTDLHFAIELIKQNTRRFAKRQLTWFTKDKDITWLQADKKELIADMIMVIQNVQ